MIAEAGGSGATWENFRRAFRFEFDCGAPETVALVEIERRKSYRVNMYLKMSQYDYTTAYHVTLPMTWYSVGHTTSAGCTQLIANHASDVRKLAEILVNRLNHGQASGPADVNNVIWLLAHRFDTYIKEAREHAMRKGHLDFLE